MGTEALANSADDMIKIRAHAVHLVDETNAWHAILIGLTPDGFRLRLHAGDGIKHANRAIQNTQRAFDFHREIHVARRINNIDAIFLVVTIPGSGRRSGRNRDAAFALLLHPVHGGRTFIHRTDLVSHTRIEQDALR